MVRNYHLYLLLLPALLYFIIFKYGPMYGCVIAFKDYSPAKGILGSDFIGMKHFIRFYHSADFWRIIKNTFILNFYTLSVTFPIPIIFALVLNQIGKLRYKKFVQTVFYVPHFISYVVIAGMVIVFLSPRSGVVNLIIKQLGFDSIFFMGKPQYFKTIYVFSEIWQNTGWSSVVFIAALTGVNPELYESAVVDGASRLQRIIYIDLPGIMPTAIVMLILKSGLIMQLGFEKVLLMQNSLNITSSEIIQTYVYKQGLQMGNFSYAAAIGLFDALINLSIVFVVNSLAKKYSETSLL